MTLVVDYFESPPIPVDAVVTSRGLVNFYNRDSM